MLIDWRESASPVKNKMKQNESQNPNQVVFVSKLKKHFFDLFYSSSRFVFLMVKVTEKVRQGLTPI